MPKYGSWLTKYYFFMQYSRIFFLQVSTHIVCVRRLKSFAVRVKRIQQLRRMLSETLSVTDGADTGRTQPPSPHEIRVTVYQRV